MVSTKGISMAMTIKVLCRYEVTIYNGQIETYGKIIYVNSSDEIEKIFDRDTSGIVGKVHLISYLPENGLRRF